MPLSIRHIEKLSETEEVWGRLVLRMESENRWQIFESTLVGPCTILPGKVQIIGEMALKRGLPLMLSSLTFSYGGFIDSRRLNANEIKAVGIDMPDTERQIQIEIEGE